jgi:hypothetical protein
VHFQLLTVIKFSDRQGGYGLIYLTIILLTSVIAFIGTNIKKINERYKEWIFHQKINNNLNKQQPENGDVSEASEPIVVSCYNGLLPFKNIVKNNIPLINGFEMAVIMGFVFAICIALLFVRRTTYDAKNFYKQFLLKELTLTSIYNIVIPVIYLTKKKKMQKCFWEYFTDAWSNTFC